MHAKGSGAHGTFTVTHDVSRYTKARIFSEVGKQTPMFARFSTVAGERGAADAERGICLLRLRSGLATFGWVSVKKRPFPNFGLSAAPRPFSATQPSRWEWPPLPHLEGVSQASAWYDGSTSTAMVKGI
jgi:hypothetical protein